MGRRRSVLAVTLAVVASTACSAPHPLRDSVETANRLRPQHAADVGADEAFDAPPVSWVHYHSSRRNANEVRHLLEPQAPEGTQAAVIESVPACRCFERALSLLDESEIPDPDDLPAVSVAGQGRTVWAWIPEARADWAYRLLLTTEPPELTVADPVAEVTGGRCARFPLRDAPREVRVRIIAAVPIRYMEVGP